MPWIHKCLTTLQKSSVKTDVFIVDNCSTDDTREYIPTHFPEVIWRPQERNLGFGQANNIGMRYAIDNDYDYVLLLNQDAYLGVDALEKMLAVSDGKSVLSPLHLNGTGTKLDPMFKVSMKMSCDVNDMMDDILLKGKPETYYHSAEIGAACWFIPLSVIKKIGGFNPLFFHYSEDNNYYHRLTFHGIKMIVVPGATVCHDRKELYGNVAAFNAKKTHRDILLIMCNINGGLFYILSQLVKTWMIYHFYLLPKKGYRLGSFSKEMLWSITHYSVLKNSRRQERREGTTWL